MQILFQEIGGRVGDHRQHVGQVQGDHLPSLGVPELLLRHRSDGHGQDRLRTLRQGPVAQHRAYLDGLDLRAAQRERGGLDLPLLPRRELPLQGLRVEPHVRPVAVGPLREGPVDVGAPLLQGVLGGRQEQRAVQPLLFRIFDHHRQWEPASFSVSNGARVPWLFVLVDLGHYRLLAIELNAPAAQVVLPFRARPPHLRALHHAGAVLRLVRALPLLVAVVERLQDELARRHGDALLNVVLLGEPALRRRRHQGLELPGVHWPILRCTVLGRHDGARNLVGSALGGSLLGALLLLLGLGLGLLGALRVAVAPGRGLLLLLAELQAPELHGAGSAL
mmetsp:Transcript_49440/g.128282  ORF Transcript_49440/g.128282 Transcript_49440/m.128282 type:complete len:335 (+) Transcript_49440:383-1387(+)